MFDALDKFLPPADRQYYSPGLICQRHDLLLSQLATLMEETAVKFDLVIDDVPLMRADGYLTLVHKLREVRQEIATARQRVRAAEDN